MLEGVAELAAGLAAASNARSARGAIGEDEDGVVGAHVTVDADSVEGVLNGIENVLLEAGLAEVRVGGDEAEHGGHAGADHAGSFGAGADADFLAVEVDGDGDFLFADIAGHDGLGDGLAIGGGEGFAERRDLVGDTIDGEGEADDAGGADADFAAGEAECLGGGVGHGPGVIDAAHSGAGIGVAAVGDDGAEILGAKVSLGDADWSSLDLVGGEGAGGDAGEIGGDDGEVVAGAFGVLDACGNSGGTESFRGAKATFDLLEGHGTRRANPELEWCQTICNPVVSANPAIRFMLWIAWLAAPLPRLSSALRRRSRPVRGSWCQPMSMKLVPVTFFVSGQPPGPRSRTKGELA